MNTRRRFLQASSLAIAGSLSDRAARAQQTAGMVPPAEAIIKHDYWNDLPNYLSSVVNTARQRRKAELAKLKSEAQVHQRASFVSSKVWELIGGKLEKTPLNVRNAGAVDRADYRIEKLIFESQPEFYVPAHLYVPKSGKGPFPSIISPLGHAQNGKVFRSYQTLFQNLARKGFVVLTWDPPGQGERFQYPVEGTNRSRFGSVGEHDKFGLPALLIGSTATQFEAWDAVRALDYLLSRPEVDSQRIGCCGHSGGGTMTMYLSALEPRIHVAVVVEGHTENVAGANYEPPGAFADAEQNIIGSLNLGIDRGDLLCAFAPKPLLICFTHMDSGLTYSPHYEQGTREIHQEVKDQYSVFGAAAKTNLFASNLPHDYDVFHRGATYDWFNKWLGNSSGDNKEADFEDAPDSALNCTSTGQILTSVGGRPAYRINSDRLHSIKAGRGSASVSKDHVRQVLPGILGLRAERAHMRSSVLSTNRFKNWAIEEVEFHSEPTVRVPGWFLKPAGSELKHGVVVVLLSSAKNHIFDFDKEDLLDAAAKQNLALCAIDVRGLAQASPRLPSSGPSFYGHGMDMAYSYVCLAAGVPMPGQRVWDALRAVDYLQSRHDVETSRIAIFADGFTGVEAMFAAALDDRIRGLLLRETLSDLSSIVEAEDYNLKYASFVFGVLRHFDLPEICGTLAPRPVWLLNATDPNGEHLAVSQVHAKYGSSARIFVRPEPHGEIFSEWMKGWA
ncbi:MAG TPA: acetylxylan esterase [Bryobacteraceae bacterium]|nr:acetylxylan esterase [Bryobacteraceae bacterium]